MNNFNYEIYMYEKILSGEIKNFNSYFFQSAYKKKRLTNLIKYLIEEKLKISPQDALTKLSRNILEEYKLTVLLKYIKRPVELDKNDLSYIVFYAYPNIKRPTQKDLTLTLFKQILNNEKKSFPKNYFLDVEKGEERVRYCIEYIRQDILKIDFKKFCQILNIELLKKYKLKILLSSIYMDEEDLLLSIYNKQYLQLKETLQKEENFNE